MGGLDNQMKKTITTTLIVTVLRGLLLTQTMAFSIHTTRTNTQEYVQQKGQELLESIHAQQMTSPSTIGDDPYHSYQEMTDLFQNLAIENSEIMSLESLGTTYEGRDIWMVKLSDNVNQQEDEPEVLLLGAHHGNEKPSFQILIYFIEHLVEYYEKPNTDDDHDGYVNEDPIDGVDNDEDGEIDEDPSEERVRTIINTTEIYLIPMVNPDGVEANTRKNVAPNYGLFGLRSEITSYGVDLNRNYDYGWLLVFLFPRLYLGSTSLYDTSSTYRGERPFCENETKAIKAFVETHDIKISISYHTYGELILFPWGYSVQPTKDDEFFISIGENISKINKYTLEQSVFLYPTLGDADDWLYARHGVAPYTIELAKSYAPGDENVIRDLSYNHVGVNLYVAEVADTVELVNIPKRMFSSLPFQIPYN